MSKSIQESSALPESGFVRQRELLNSIPFSPATLWRKVKKGEFPRPVKLSDHITAWHVDAIRQWIESRC